MKTTYVSITHLINIEQKAIISRKKYNMYRYYSSSETGDNLEMLT